MPKNSLRDVVDPLVRASMMGAYTAMRAYWRVAKPATEGCCVALWHRDAVLLIQNSYKRTFSLPGGGRHRREAWDVAASRELREEVGVDVSAEALGACAYEATTTLEHKTDHVKIFEHHIDATPLITIDRREVVWASFVDAREALKLPLWPLVHEYLAWRTAHPSTLRRAPT